MKNFIANIITAEKKEILIKRLKSFCWRASAVVAVMIVNFAAENVGLFDLPEQVQFVIGLILGEVTKYLNTKTN